MSNIQAELDSLARLDDRLISTKNENLGGVLRVVLPKLILLMNKDELRIHVMKMFKSILARLKTLPSNECEVPLSGLFDLIRRQHLHFACNFAMTFIDVRWETQESRVQEQVATSVLHSLADWPIYTLQSNALLVYTLPLMPVLASGMRAYVASGGDKANDLREILGDFYMDVALVRSDVLAGAAGSIQPGLSAPKVARLTTKNKQVLASDLRSVKLALIEQLTTDSPLFNAWNGILISVILAFDPDSTVAQQAAHKMAAYAANTDTTNASVMQATLSRLLRSCSAGKPTVKVPTIDMAGNFAEHEVVRSPLREDVRAAVFRWVHKEAKTGLVHASKDVLAIFIETFFVAAPDASSGKRVRSSLMAVALELGHGLDDSTFGAHAKVLFRGCTSVLEAFTRTRTKGAGSDSDEALLLRERCYKLVEMVGRRCALVASEDAKIIATLFKLLDHEDERLAPQLYSCLGVLREVYQERAALLIGAKADNDNDEDQVGDQGHGGTGTEMVVAGAEAEAKPDAEVEMDVDVDVDASISPLAASLAQEDIDSLREVLGAASCSAEHKKRLAALQWAHAVFGWQAITLRTLVLLADDEAETVKALCIKNFGALRAFLVTPSTGTGTGTGTGTASGEGEGEDGSSSLSREEVTATILHMLHRPSVTLLDPRRIRARREVMLAAAAALEAWMRTTSTSGGDKSGGAAVAASGEKQEESAWSWERSLRRPDAGTTTVGIIDGSVRPLLPLLPDIFSTLRNFPKDSTESAPSTALALSRLARIMAASAASASASASAARATSGTDDDDDAGAHTNMMKAVDAVEDLLCGWLSTMSESVGHCVAETLGTRCLHPSADADFLLSLHAKVTKCLHPSASTSASRANGLRALGAIAVALEARLGAGPGHSNGNGNGNGNGDSPVQGADVLPVPVSLIEAGKTILRSLFHGLHAAMSGILLADGQLTSDSDVARLGAAAVQVWAQIVESGVFANPHMAIALSLNRSPSGSGSITEDLVRVVAAFRDLTARRGAGTTSAAAAPVAGAGAGAGTDLGPLRTSHMPGSSSNAGESGPGDDRGERDGNRDGGSRRLEVLEEVASQSVHALASFLIHSQSTEATPELAVLLWGLFASPALWYDDGNRDLLRVSIGEGLVRLAYLLDAGKTQAILASLSPSPSPGSADSTATATATAAAAGGSDMAMAVDSDFHLERRRQEQAQAQLLGSSLPACMAALAQKVAFLANDNDSTSKRSRGAAAALLLVLIRNLAPLTRHWRAVEPAAAAKGEAPGQGLVSYELMLFLLDTSLLLLKHGDSFTQDLACLSLCHLHSLSRAAFSPSHLMYGKTVSARISDEVVSALSRDRRAAQPVGVAAGASASSSASSSNGDGDGERQGSTTGTGSNNNADEATPDAEERRRREREALENAAAAAARQVGMNIDEIRGNIESAVEAAGSGAAPPLPAWRRRDPDPGNFGVYSTAIKLAKKSGDATVVFGVLALIRRHPSFGSADTPTALVYQAYKPVISKMEPDKMQALVPMLFAARFDPYTTVREVMHQLWDILIPPTSSQMALTTLLQRQILRYLANLLYSPVWRDRESACAALENFLVRRSWKQVRVRLETLWLGGMKVVDDVRDSARMASLGFIKTLTDQVLRAANPQESPEATVKDCLDLILPLLLEKGLVAPSPEARGVTMGVLVSLVKTSKRHLGDWLPRLIGVCVECMSAMEPQTLQYMSFHTARLKMSEEELDRMRLEMAKSSPMQQALDGCLASLSEGHVPDVVYHLTSSLSHGVGMPSRAAAAASLSHVVEKYPSRLGVHVNKAFDQVLTLLVSNPRMQAGLKRTLLSCLGSVGRAVDNICMEASAHRLIATYHSLARDDRTDGAAVVAACLQAIVNRCGNKLVDHDIWTQVLAIAYIGSFDTDEAARETWQAVNGEALTQSGAGNKITALNRAVSIILDIVLQYLLDLSWTRREHGMRVLQDVVKSLPEQERAALLSPHPHMARVAQALLALIKPQIWTGQELALESISLLCARCESLLDVAAPDSTLLLFAREGMDTQVLVSTGGFLDKLRPASSSPSGAGGAPDTTMTPPLPSTDTPGHCAFGARGLLELLLREAGRGPKNYRLAASIAISSLPWRRMTQSAPGLQLVIQRLPMFCAVVGVEPYAHKRGSPDGDGETGVAAKARGTRGPSEQQRIRATTRPVYSKKSSSSLSLFGARYGASASASASAVPARGSNGPPPHGRNGDDIEEGEIVQLHDPLTTGAIVRVGQAQAQAQAQAHVDGVAANERRAASVGEDTAHMVDMVDMDVEVGSDGGQAGSATGAGAALLGQAEAEAEAEAQTQTQAQAQAEAQAEVSDTGAEVMARDARLRALLQGSMTEPETEAETEAEAEAGTGEEMDATGDMDIEGAHSNSESGAAAFTAVPHSADPAFRAKFLESIAAAWPTDINVRSGLAAPAPPVSPAEGEDKDKDKDLVSSLKTLASALLKWVADVGMREEGWALRRAALVGVEAVMLARDQPLGTFTLAGGAAGQPLDDAIGARIIDAALIQVALRAVKTGAADAKHAKVRTAAYHALEAAMHRVKFMMTNDSGSSVSSLLSEEACEDVRVVIRAAAGETQADLLRKAGELQALWQEVKSLLPKE